MWHGHNKYPHGSRGGHTHQGPRNYNTNKGNYERRPWKFKFNDEKQWPALNQSYQHQRRPQQAHVNYQGRPWNSFFNNKKQWPAPNQSYQHQRNPQQAHVNQKRPEPSLEAIFTRIERVSRHEQKTKPRTYQIKKDGTNTISHQMINNIKLNEATAQIAILDIKETQKKMFQIYTLFIVSRNNDRPKLFFSESDISDSKTIIRDTLNTPDAVTSDLALIHHEDTIYCIEPKDAFDTQKLPPAPINLNRSIDIYQNNGDYYTLCRHPILINKKIKKESIQQTKAPTSTTTSAKIFELREDFYSCIKEDNSLVFKIQIGTYNEVEMISKVLNTNNRSHKHIIKSIMSNTEIAKATEVYIITKSQNDVTESGFLINTGSDKIYAKCPMLSLYNVTTDIDDDGNTVNENHENTWNTEAIFQRIRTLNKAISVTAGQEDHNEAEPRVQTQGDNADGENRDAQTESVEGRLESVNKSPENGTEVSDDGYDSWGDASDRPGIPYDENTPWDDSPENLK